MKKWYPKKIGQELKFKVPTHKGLSPRGSRISVHNPAHAAFGNSLRIYRAIKCAPPWLTDSQLAEMKEFYLESSLKKLATGIPHEVDHIEPINGENSCGLHVPWNLRVITRWSNRSKHNKLIENL